MNIMNFDKALNILGLTRNYTEEDLKRAYRKLMTKYHPDKWEGKSETEKKMAEEKSKEINAAKEFLEKYKGQKTETYTNNNNNYNNYYNYVAFVQAKMDFINKINNYEIELMNLMVSKEILLLKKIKQIKKLNYEFRNKVTFIKNINDLKFEKTKYEIEIWRILETFTEEYCKKYNINYNQSKLEKYSLKKLYEQLEKLRKEQNSIETKLNRKQEEYILYAGYNVIKRNIERIKITIVKEYNERLISEDKAMSSFEKKILEEFKEYYRRLEVINYFKNLGYKDKEIIDTIALMEECITTDKITFKAYEKQLTNLIAEKETRKTPGRSTKIFNTKEKIEYNYNYKITKKDYIIKDKYCIKHSPSEEPKYKIKKNR